MYYFTYFTEILQLYYNSFFHNSDRDLENLTGGDLTCADTTVFLSHNWLSLKTQLADDLQMTLCKSTALCVCDVKKNKQALHLNKAMPHWGLMGDLCL